MTRDGAPGRLWGSRRSRTLLTVFFVLHWGAVGTYLLPTERASVELFPGIGQRITYALAPRLARATWPVARPYLDMTATRQHWTLFAPWPANWENSVRVAPFFPVPGRDDLWVVDTLVVEGPRERPYPHILDHRTFRVLYNLGYENWGDVYRPYFAREMCRTLRTPDGRAPSGVALVVEWWLMEPPWWERTGERYRQWLGGYDCAEEDGGPPVERWTAYGLPAVVDPTGWDTVTVRDTTTAAGEPEGSVR